MDGELPEVVLITTASVDGRITLGLHQRLLEPAVAERWASIQVANAFQDRPADIGSDVFLGGSGSFVDVDATAPTWPQPSTPDDELRRDHLPRTAPRWFIVADSRGRVDWTFIGDETTILHVLVCRDTPSGYLQRLRDLGVGYFVVGDSQVDPRTALVRIRQVLHADRVIVDSGGTLNAALLRAGLVDVVDVVTLPGIVGGTGTPSFADGPPLADGDWPVRLQLLDSRVEHGAVRTRYRVLRQARGLTRATWNRRDGDTLQGGARPEGTATG